MTPPTYTLDHVRAALGDDAADKVRTYVPPLPVSPELRLARECAAKLHRDAERFTSASKIEAGQVDDEEDYGVSSALLALQRRHELDAPAKPVADDGWISWHGGECPVDENAMVDIRFLDGDVIPRRHAKNWYWKHSGEASDITAYKPDPGK